MKCGIDIGGTNIKFGIFNKDRKPYLFKIKTPKENIVESIVEALKSKVDITMIEGYTVAIPGVMENGVVIYAPNTNIVGVRLKEELERELGNTNLIVDNDANIQALAESKVSGLENMLLLTIGTGLGGGIILNNKLHNHNGFAGEVGHIKVYFGPTARKCGCGKYGCAEAYVSTKNIVKEYNEVYNANINAKELFDLAINNDTVALKSVNECARLLAVTISNIVCVLGIKNVRITGGMSNAGEFFLEKVRYYYKRFALPNMEDVKIEIAELKDNAGVFAAKYLI